MNKKYLAVFTILVFLVSLSIVNAGFFDFFRVSNWKSEDTGIDSAQNKEVVAAPNPKKQQTTKGNSRQSNIYTEGESFNYLNYNITIEDIDPTQVEFYIHDDQNMLITDNCGIGDFVKPESLGYNIEVRNIYDQNYAVELYIYQEPLLRSSLKVSYIKPLTDLLSNNLQIHGGNILELGANLINIEGEVLFEEDAGFVSTINVHGPLYAGDNLKVDKSLRVVEDVVFDDLSGDGYAFVCVDGNGTLVRSDISCDELNPDNSKKEVNPTQPNLT